MNRVLSDVVKDTEEIVDAAQKRAYQSVNVLLMQRNWLIGRRIAEEELSQSGRAEYGLEVIKSLAKSLTKRYGRGFTKSNLYRRVLKKCGYRIADYTSPINL